MKSKTKFLISLSIAVLLLLGASYFFLAEQAETGKSRTRSDVSLSNVQTTPPATVANSPLEPPAPPEKPGEPEHQLPSVVTSRPQYDKNPVHEDSHVPLYEGPTKATGDDCTDPIMVSLPAALPYSDLSQTTCGRMDDYDDGTNATCMWYYDGGEDIIYEVTVTSAVDVDITMDPKGTTYTGVAIDNSCPPDDDCIAYSYGSSGSQVCAGVHLEPGTYYIMVDTWPSPDCIPDFDLTITAAAGPPPNDDCANAEAVGDVTDLPFSTSLASFDGGGSCMTSPNIWYLYTATCTGEVHVALCGSEYDTKLAVYDGASCDPLGTEIGCNDDACYGAKALQSELTFAGTQGNQYLIEVGGYSSSTGDGILNITCTAPENGACCNDLDPYDCQILTEAECNALPDHTFLGLGTDCGPPNPCDPSGPPPNDDCDGAITIYPPDCPSVQTVSGTTVGSTIDCPGVLDWYAVWYVFELTYDCNNVTIDYCPTNLSTVYTRGVVLYDECPTDCPNYILYTGYSWVTCSSGYTDLVLWFDNLPAGTYYLPVYVVDQGGNPLDFAFDICVEECEPLGPGNDCTDPLAVTLPADMPYADLSQTTCGRIDDYDDPTNATCMYYYDGGEDIIYEVTVTSAVDVDITMDPKGTTWNGVAIDNSCPPDDDCIAYSTGSSGSPKVLVGVHLEPGTYYIMVDTWPSPDCIPDFDLTIEESGGGLENDDCADATPVSDVTDLPFTTLGSSFDGTGSCMTSGNVWYLYTATCDGNVHVSLCGSYYDTKVAAYDGASCDPLGTELACNDDACGGTLQSEIFFTGVQGNQYLIEVGGYSSNTGDGLMSISCTVGPDNDNCEGAPVINTFPTTVYGSTIGAGIDCPGVLDWNAVWYQFDVPYASNDIYVDYCPTDGEIYTVGIVLYDECPPDCPGYIIADGYQFVSCPSGYTNPQMWWYDMPGPASYWFPVYAVPAKDKQMDFGFEVSIEEAVPCTVACPEGGRPENEPICEDDWEDIWNGGCNSAGPPYPFEDVDCGWTICGTSGTYLYYGSNYRDTDWFRVLAGDGQLTYKCVAEFPLLIFLIDAGSEDCVDFTIIDYITVEPCDTATLSYYVSAGYYWLWVGPSVFDGVPCGAEYVMSVECSPFGPQIVVDPMSMYPILNPDELYDEIMNITNSGGENLDYSIAENPEVTWLSVSPTSNTVSPGTTDPVTVSFDATGLAAGDYYTDLVITSNALNDPEVTVVIHLEVELPPDIDVQTTMSAGVLPGCAMGKALQVSNLGTGDLRYEISVGDSPPALMAGESNIRQALEALREAGQADPNLVPKEAYKAIGGTRAKAQHISGGTSEGLLLSAGAGKQADILLVDDDGGLPGGTYSDIEYAYIDALDDGGFVYDYYVVDWTDPLSNGPDLGTMQAYNCVIWFTGETWGYYGYDVLTPADETNLASFLDGGGNLFLSSQDYLYASYPSAGSFSPGQFPYDYLGLGSVSQDAINDPYSVIGGTGSVADGMGFDALRCYSNNPDVPLWTDYVFGQGGALDVLLVYGTDPSAVQYDGGGFKTVFTTTEFCGLVDGSPSLRADLMASIMGWFGCGGAACPFTVTPEQGTIPPDSFFDVVLNFDGTVFTQCVDESITCYLTISSNDPDEPVVSVQVDMWSGRGDVMTPYCLIDAGDVVYLINFVLQGGPAPSPMCMGDCNPPHDDLVDMEDILYVTQYLYQGGMPPLATPEINQPAKPRTFERK